MFDRLSDGFGNVFRKLSGKASISESNIKDAMTEVRDALLEADVHYDVVNDFIEEVSDQAIGGKVTKSLKPGQEVIGIVNEKLVELLGGRPEEGGPTPGVLRASPGPTVIMMCGLQGSGKTTTCGKLAAYLKKRGRSVLLVAADLQRPAAVEQLETLAAQVRDEAPGSAKIEFYGEPDQCAEYGKAVGVAVKVCQRALKHAQKENIDTVILDTAGRLHVNDELMGELHKVNNALSPQQIFLVVDAMTGQDAVNSAKAFHERLNVDGVILTKFDSDTRGGAAISVKRVTGAPIKFIGVGEKIAALEEFHAERMAGRILGMGDVVSLVEKARDEVSDEEAERIQEKMMRGELTMDDFLKQLRTLRRMGPLKQVMGLLPGVGSMLKDVNIDDKQLDQTEAMVSSMTTEERTKPSVISNSRRRRIAKGSGTDTQQVGGLVKQFGAISKLTKSMAGLSGKDKVKAAKEMASGGGMAGEMGGLAGLPGLRTKGSTKSSGKRRGVKQRKRKR